MPANLQRFINPKFVRTIDLALMRELFARHHASSPVDFERPEAEVRAALREHFGGRAGEWSAGLVADLHRVAEVGTRDGLEIVLNEARRQGVRLRPAAADGAPSADDPKHVALRVYLHHPRVFEAAADVAALRSRTAVAEFRGPERDVAPDLAPESRDAFTDAMRALFEADFRGGYCRLGVYDGEGELDLVVSHGAPLRTTPVIEGDREAILPIRELKTATLRYSPAEGLLRIGGVSKARQPEVAELFARHLLDRPGLFAGPDARDLYTLDPVTRFGPDFEFDHAYDERILDVRIVSAVADLFTSDGDDRRRYVRGLVSVDPAGAALKRFASSEVRFGEAWRVGEITFEVDFRRDDGRRSRVQVRLKPPGTLAFRRKVFEKAVHELLARHGLERARDAELVLAAAE